MAPGCRRLIVLLGTRAASACIRHRSQSFAAALKQILDGGFYGWTKVLGWGGRHKRPLPSKPNWKYPAVRFSPLIRLSSPLGAGIGVRLEATFNHFQLRLRKERRFFFFLPESAGLTFILRPSMKFSIQCFDGLIGFRIAGHFHKTESFGLARTAVHNHFCHFHFSEFGKHGLQIIPGDGKRKIANIDVHDRVLSANACLRPQWTKKGHSLPAGEEMPF